MTLIAVDIGNTDAKFGLFDDQTLLGFWRTPSSQATPQSLTAFFKNWPIDVEAVEGIIYCCVSPSAEKQLLPELTAFLSTRRQTPLPQPLAVIPSVMAHPIDLNGYPSEQLGADRLVNLCAAYDLLPGQSVLIADFGTATTLDALHASGAYVGGAITPGLETFAGILRQKTAQLPEVLTMKPGTALGKSTQACLQAGVGWGYVGLMRELLDRAMREFSPQQPVCRVATGGLSKRFLNLVEATADPWFHRIDPCWTLRGLRFLYDYNVSASRREQSPRGVGLRCLCP